uniref:Protein-lysine N-methyltransferase n=1 Tax=Globodera rostochiensis TaxID=31243 RepID=A0A914HAJ1_GLORO
MEIDNTDDDLSLSQSTLLALNEFLQDQERSRKDGHLFENWQLSQFWYTDETCRQLVDECICALNGSGRVACLSCPSVVAHFMDTKEVKTNAIELSLFEYDTRFADKFGNAFVYYDYRRPLDVPDKFHHQFDVLLVDPPFLSDECLIKVAQTIRLLSKRSESGGSKLLVNTGVVMEQLLKRILDVKKTDFRPSHKNNLANEFYKQHPNQQTRTTTSPMAFGIAQHQLWTEILCCPKCGNVFSVEHLPVTLSCGHLLCSCCVDEHAFCPFDKTAAKWDGSSKMYVNVPVLSIVLGDEELAKQHMERSMKSLCSSDSPQYETVKRLECSLQTFASFLYKVDSEKGATVSSSRLGRAIQHKLFSLLCANLWQEESRAQMLKLLRSMSGQIVSELIPCIEGTVNLSSALWSAVRARGCQFLGPAPQEDVLRHIHRALMRGELLARKTLVLHIVDKLSCQHSSISKTCVGHVVQLLYRASCFNVIKQEGQSSLMQLKEEFRSFETLRFEHDSQIVQIAIDAGLRTHMQTVCDRINSKSLQTDALRKLIDKKQAERNLFGIQTKLEHFDALFTAENLNASENEVWTQIEELLVHMSEVLKVYSDFFENRNAEKEQRRSQKAYVLSRGGRCQDVALLNNGGDHAGVGRTPLRSLARMPPIPIDFGCRPNMVHPPLLYAPQPPQTTTLTTTYIEQPPFPMGSPPGFYTSMSVSSTPFLPPSTNNNNVGSPPLSSPYIQQKQFQMDALETMPGQFFSILPTHPFGPTFVQPLNTVTASANTILTSTTVPSTNNSPLDGRTTLFATAQSTSPFSTSPPGYQFSPASTHMVAPPGAFQIPVQPQSLIVYGSPPFGSPPLLLSPFTNWTTPLDSTGGLLNGANYCNINTVNNNNNTTSLAERSPQKRNEQSFESEEDHQTPNVKRERKYRHSSRTTVDEDDSECHVSFTVATSVLHGHDEEHSFGSVGWMELPPLPVGQLNMHIPLSPSNVTYTVACDSAKTNLCTIIRPSTSSASTSNTLMTMCPPVSALPIVQDLGTDAAVLKDIPVS